MYCLGCGSEIAFGAVECPNCHLPAGEPSLEGLRTISLAGLVRGETITSPAEPEQSLEGSSWADATIGPEPAELEPGTVWGSRYEIERLLGEGGMGAVYLARDREINRYVALKVIRPQLAGNPAVLRRFRRELVLARKVTHPNVVRIFDLGIVGGLRYISMEYIEGRQLSALIDETGNSSLEVTIPAFPGSGQ